jgi:hypothetical protein
VLDQIRDESVPVAIANEITVEIQATDGDNYEWALYAL